MDKSLCIISVTNMVDIHILSVRSKPLPMEDLARMIWKDSEYLSSMYTSFIAFFDDVIDEETHGNYGLINNVNYILHERNKLELYSIDYSEIDND